MWATCTYSWGCHRWQNKSEQRQRPTHFGRGEQRFAKAPNQPQSHNLLLSSAVAKRHSTFKRTLTKQRATAFSACYYCQSPDQPLSRRETRAHTHPQGTPINTIHSPVKPSESGHLTYSKTNKGRDKRPCNGVDRRPEARQSTLFGRKTPPRWERGVGGSLDRLNHKQAQSFATRTPEKYCS